MQEGGGERGGEERGGERRGGVLFGKNQTASVTVSLHIYNIVFYFKL